MNISNRISFFFPPILSKLSIKTIALFFIIVIPTIAQAQLELYAKFNPDGSVNPVINYNGSKRINDQFSLVFFGLIREQWSQALIGLSYSPTSSIRFSATAGIEHGQSSPRYSASVWLKKNKTTFLILGELGSGHENYLYKINVFHEFSEKFSLGVMDWRYHGLGPNVRYTIPKLQSTIWVMPAYDHEQKIFRSIVGISVQM